MIFANFIDVVSDDCRSGCVLTFKLDGLEVVKLSLVEVGQIPKDADVFKTKVVPFVGIGVVWHFVFVHVLSLSPSAGKFH